MENLSSKQQGIVNSIIAEFQEINKKSASKSDMIAYINREIDESKLKKHHAKEQSDARRVAIDEYLAEIEIKVRDIASEFGINFYSSRHLEQTRGLKSDNIIEYVEMWIVGGTRSLKLYPSKIWVEGELFYLGLDFKVLAGGASHIESDIASIEKEFANQIINIIKNK
jgi:hypothetical protein